MRRITVLTTVLAIALAGLVAPTPAAAQATDTLACLSTIPDAGFADVDPASVHKRDIDCISWYDITLQVGSYNPKQTVSRWQMALFITRTIGVIQGLPDGSNQGFADLGQLSSESHTAINQLGQYGITKGTTPTTYDPNGTVTRWQMALFLTRTVQAAGFALPDGSDQGFTDINGLFPEAQTAINQVKQLGITTGTSPTTFSPNGTVTREQMASFLARTLNVIWRLNIRWFAPTCDATGSTCSGDGWFPANRTFLVRQGFGVVLPWEPGEEQEFPSPNTRFELTLDGQPVATTEKLVEFDAIKFRWWDVSYPGGLLGLHTFFGRWYWDGNLELTVTATIDFVP